MAVKTHLGSIGKYTIEDVGCVNADDDTPYYHAAVAAAKQVALDETKETRAILCCGIGMGMAIVANKFPGVYASVCESIYAAGKCRAINNSNVLTMGEFITAPVLAADIVDAWLETSFASGFDSTITAIIKQASEDIQTIEKEAFGKIG